MFSDSAKWYDALYASKDYQDESERIAAIVRGKCPGARTVLDVACGTGEHARHLSREFRVDGLDLNAEFLAIARDKNPEGVYVCADMTGFDIGRNYDAVLCLFSSVAYVKTLGMLGRALECFGRHLAPGGVLVVEPWFTPDAWKPSGKVYTEIAETDEGTICRMNISETDGDRSVLDFHYLIGTAAGVRHFTEHHELGLFSRGDMEQAFREAGFVVEYDEKGITGRGLYVARYESVG